MAWRLVASAPSNRTQPSGRNQRKKCWTGSTRSPARPRGANRPSIRSLTGDSLRLVRPLAHPLVDNPSGKREHADWDEYSKRCYSRRDESNEIAPCPANRFGDWILTRRLSEDRHWLVQRYRERAHSNA